MNNDPFLPPIMQTPGLHLVGIGERLGRTYLKFSTGGNKPGVREVVLFIDVAGPLNYVYTKFDGDTRTVITFSGPHGDPEKDTIVGDIRSYF